MSNYRHMYLVPVDVYDRVIKQQQQLLNEDRKPGNGDSLTGNVHGQAQVNHIEMAEGAKLTIKPNRTVAAVNGSEGEGDDREGRRNPSAAADRVAEQREKELQDEDENDVPYVVGDALDREVSTHGVQVGQRPETTDRGVQAEREELPAVISGVTAATQTPARASTTAAAVQADPSGKTTATQTPARASTSSAAVQAGPEPAERSNALSQTDPVPKFNMKDMTDLRRKAMANWANVRRAQRGDPSEPVRKMPYVKLNDNVPMEDKVNMLRKVTDAQLESMLGNETERPGAPAISTVSVSPARAIDEDPVKKHPLSVVRVATGKKAAKKAAKKARKQKIEESIRGVLNTKKEKRRVQESIRNVLDDAQDQDWMDRLQEYDEEMKEVENTNKRGKRKRDAKPGGSPIKKRQTRSQTKKTKQQLEEQEVVNERLATLQGKAGRQRGKRAATEMEWPEEIEVRSGLSKPKGFRKK